MLAGTEDVGSLRHDARLASSAQIGPVGRELLAAQERKAERLPFASGREVVTIPWLRSKPSDLPAERVVTPARVLEVVR